MKRILICKYETYIINALYDGTQMIEAHCEPMENPSILDQIYVGKVTKIVKNINAAFLNIGIGVDCYYSIEENHNPVFVKKSGKKDLVVGDELLVQVIKEQQKNKVPTVSSNLSFRGRNLILTTGKHNFGISKKIQGDRRAELSDLLKDKKQSGIGLIVRTNAQLYTNEEVLQELEELQKEYQTKIEQWKHRTCFSCVESAVPSYLSALQNSYKGQYDEIVTDDSKLYQEMKQFLDIEQHDDLEKLRFYEDEQLPLAKLYSVETNLRHALNEKVWLKSGAYLVIQPTEALTVIDVNSGKNVAKGSKQENLWKINLEAADEIAKQLRLRNLSGIILVDFIDMNEHENQNRLMQYMKELFLKDPITTNVIDMTRLNLMEITRKKLRKPLSEQLEKISDRG